MRHIELDNLLAQIFSGADGQKDKARLHKAHNKLAGMVPADRVEHTRNNGVNKWKPIKDRLIELLGQKCWYTEVELIGGPLAIDHYRPICDYWWLAFDAENYRVSCPWANSPEYNVAHGCAGGKGDNFPLLPPGLRAKEKNRLSIERPVILDPCKSEDCDLLAFDTTGRPILHPDSAANPIAAYRVEKSTLLLNLDHHTFNTKREQLCIRIREEVDLHEELPEGSPGRATIRTRLEERLAPKAPFSTAARAYLALHRHLDWVEQIINPP